MDSVALDNDLIKGPHIELFYNNRAVVEGCIGVYEYNDTYLKLRLSKGALILNGEAFDILTFEDKTITVKGKINSLEFCLQVDVCYIFIDFFAVFQSLNFLGYIPKKY